MRCSPWKAPMHELSVCQGLLSQVLRVADEHGAPRVERILIHVGPLAGVEPRLLADAFPFASAGTIAEGAELVIETQGIRVLCSNCGAETEATANRLVCGVCGNWKTQLVSGDELTLVSVELLQH
jgi:hydrogenase nickel incorporation protein HypA/HybF